MTLSPRFSIWEATAAPDYSTQHGCDTLRPSVWWLEHVGSIHLQSLDCAPVTGSDIDPPSSGPALDGAFLFSCYQTIDIAA
jgi:hypothetical protein